MKDLFIDFCADCELNSIYKLFEIINNNPSTRIVLRISSIKGNCFAGILAFNKLNAISNNIELVTYNSSSISASALPIYYAGNKRYAASTSDFQIGVNQWSSEKRDLEGLVEDYHRNMSFDEIVIRIFKYRNDLINFDIENKFYNCETISIEEALNTRLVHEIRENIKNELINVDYSYFIISQDINDKLVVQQLI
ncbi:hypothetical protein [Neobacillus sp. FSL H8-0543]|uniref:hypothetical protein n=1 Tax=Neobacillus sp. FSL H8-0543 TaxID=2954672 RepID=UPI0031581280